MVSANFFGGDCVVLKLWLRVHVFSLKSMAVEKEIVEHSVAKPAMPSGRSRVEALE